MPELPPATGYVFPASTAVDDLVGVGADLEPGTVLEAYCQGVFPMGLGADGGPPLGWWSPDPRGIIRLGDLRVSRSLARSMRRFETTVDTDFAGVLRGCADPARDGRWITPGIAAAYQRLHELGWAHSVEVRRGGALVGGLYGIAIGGLFAGESMFHTATDASKVALVALRDILRADGDSRRLLDVQWETPHLASLGATTVSRARYLRLLRTALRAPLPPVWA